MSVTKFPAIRRRKQGYLSLKHKFGSYEISLFSSNDDRQVSVVIKAYGHSVIRVIRKHEKFARRIAFAKLRSTIISASHTMIRIGEDSKVIEAGYRSILRCVMITQRQLERVERKLTSDDVEDRTWAEAVAPKIRNKLAEKESILKEFECHPRIKLLNFKDMESANS